MSQSLLLLFGGASDASHENVRRHVPAYRNFFGPDITVKYFSHMDKCEALKLLKKEKPRKTALIGHSYGGDTAYLVARDCNLSKIDCLVTIDPVSRWTFNIKKPPRVKQWINSWVEGFQDLSDVVAVLGGHWGHVDSATENRRVSHLSHGQFAGLMRPHLNKVKKALTP